MTMIPLSLTGVFVFWILLVGSFRPARISRVFSIDAPPRKRASGFVGDLEAAAVNLMRLFWAVILAMYGALLGGVLYRVQEGAPMWRFPAAAAALAWPIVLIGFFVLLFRLARHLNVVAQIRPRLVPKSARPVRYVYAGGLGYTFVMFLGSSVMAIARGFVA